MAKKYNSAYDGTPIQIKRTGLSLDADAEKINNDYIGRDSSKRGLKHGEPLYLNYIDKDGNEVDYLAIGKEDHVDTSNLKVFKALPRLYAEGTLFFDLNSREDISNRVDLIDLNGTNIYTKFKLFTLRNEAGIPIDKNLFELSKTKTAIYIPRSNKDLSLTTWKKVDSSGNILDTELANVNDFPKAVRIKLTGMTADTVPYIGLALNDVLLGSRNNTKETRRAFSNVTSVESYYINENDCGLIVFCGYKNIVQDCYIDVFGG